MGHHSFVFSLRAEYERAAVRDRRLSDPALRPLRAVMDRFGASVDCVVRYSASSGQVHPAVFTVRVPPDRAVGLLEALNAESMQPFVRKALYEEVPEMGPSP